MSKLSDIIDAATGDAIPVPTLLRMVKVLAGRTETAVLDDWVDNELGGYANDAPLPSYRGPFETQVLSEWSGPMSSILHNVPLPPSAFPEGLRAAGAFEVEFRESVSELARLSQAEGPLSYGWGTDAVGRINGEILGGRLRGVARIAPMHGIVSAHRLVSPALIGSVLDQVRTRVLSFTLDLERIAPDAGEPGVKINDPDTVTNIVNFIYGSGNTVALGSPGAVQVGNVAAGDLEGLLTAVSALGLPSDQVAELRQAIEADEADEDSPKVGVGTRVKQFMGNAAMGGLTIAGETGTQEGIKMLGKLVGNYFGIAQT